ncbi:MAG: sodium:proton antiporter [Bacteroidales bacterium]|jgi:Na+/H+ antiporter NhaD/arsenite permease-like protein|nr:sodium:proton antiporter [Bacteroidales bacterium]
MILIDSSLETVNLQLWTLIPFALMLLMIAIAPLFMGHWWEKNSNKLIISLVLGIPTAAFLIYKGLSHELTHQLIFDYIPFIVLLGALFTVTGGIHLKGDIQAKPWINTLFLGIGAILASIMGTTGAAMLLIRPIIKTNSQRKYKAHTILFFIACVANCGGLLTPLGDPPLFLLYLRGIDFTWFLSLLPEWALANLLLLITYFCMDSYYYKKESKENIVKDKSEKVPIRIEGKLNFIWLLGIVLSVAFLNSGYISIMGENPYFGFLRDGALILMATLSLIFTKKIVREKNKFSWTPILEVAVLFFGIFITMTPALLYLAVNAQNFGFTEPWQFYFTTGALSSFLDNAPTAISFYQLAEGSHLIGDVMIAGIPEIIMKAICVGAVFFGSMTYIGNGPNFMVKAIAEENKISMPSFFGYMIKFSLIILLPIYIIVYLICIY